MKLMIAFPSQGEGEAESGPHALRTATVRPASRNGIGTFAERNRPKSRLAWISPGYAWPMSTLRTDGRSDGSDTRALWSEALWGVGLLGTVLISVALIAAIFGGH